MLKAYAYCILYDIWPMTGEAGEAVSWVANIKVAYLRNTFVSGLWSFFWCYLNLYPYLLLLPHINPEETHTRLVECATIAFQLARVAEEDPWVRGSVIYSIWYKMVYGIWDATEVARGSDLSQNSIRATSVSGKPQKAKVNPLTVDQ